MLKVCGKAVTNLGTGHGISMGKTSTGSTLKTLTHSYGSVQPPVSHSIPLSSPQYLSTVISRASSLIEHYFYPVSTAPITILTKEKLKKGI
jgi:hypothetical protein